MSAQLPEFVNPIEADSVYIAPNIDSTQPDLLHEIITKFNEDVTPEEGSFFKKRTISDQLFGAVRTPDGKVFLLGSGDHKLARGYEWATYDNGDHEYVNMSLDTNYRINGRGSIVYVPEGHVVKAKIGDKNILLAPGVHVYNNPRFVCEYENQQAEQGKKPEDKLLIDVDQEYMKHGTITRVVVELGSVGVAKINGKLTLLNPGVYMYDIANTAPGHPEYRDKFEYYSSIKMIESIVPCHNGKGSNIDLDIKDDPNNIDIQVSLQTTLKIKKTKDFAPQYVHALESLESIGLENLRDANNMLLGRLYRAVLKAAFDDADKVALHKHGDDRKYLQKIIDDKLASFVDVAQTKTYRTQLQEEYGIELVELTIDSTKLVDRVKLKQEMEAKKAIQNGHAAVTPVSAARPVQSASAADILARTQAVDDYFVRLQSLKDAKDAIIKDALLQAGGNDDIFKTILGLRKAELESLDKLISALSEQKLAPILSGTKSNFFQPTSRSGSASPSPSASPQVSPRAPSPAPNPQGGSGTGNN